MKKLEIISSAADIVKKVGVTASAVAGPVAFGIGMYDNIKWLGITGLFMLAIPYGLVLRPFVDNASMPEESSSSPNDREREYEAIEQEIDPLNYKN